MKVTGFFIFLFLFFTLAAGAEASAAANDDALGGRWHLSFEMPEGFYQTPVEFIVESDGKVKLAVLGSLGSFKISPGEGRFSKGKLSLDAKTSFGKLKVAVTVKNGILRGKWQPAGLFAGLFFRGEVRGERQMENAPAAAARAEIFDAVWREINLRFYDPNFNGANWQAARERFRPQVEKARSDGEFIAVMRQMLAELKASHLEFFALPDDLSIWTPKQKEAAKTVSWQKIAPDVGYLKIASFNEDAARLAEIDRAFAEFGNLPFLIIDVRGNAGGSFGLALRAGDHLLKEKRAAGYFVTREGLSKRGAASIDKIDPASLPVFSGYDAAGFFKVLDSSGAVMLETGGRAEKQYKGRMVLLVDEYTGSAAEAFAAVMKEIGTAAVVGRRTAGMMLGADLVSISGDWKLFLPVMDFRTPGGRRIEGAGVEPHIFVKAKSKGDAGIQKALQFLKSF